MSLHNFACICYEPKGSSSFFLLFFRSLDWYQLYGPTPAPHLVTKRLTNISWWQVSEWPPAIRSWTRGFISCWDVPSSEKSTASLKSRPASREALSGAGISAPFRTQRKKKLIPKVLNKKSISRPGLNKTVIVSGDVKCSELDDHLLPKENLLWFYKGKNADYGKEKSLSCLKADVKNEKDTMSRTLPCSHFLK